MNTGQEQDSVSCPNFYMLSLVPYRNRHQTDTKFVEGLGPTETVSADGCQRLAEMPLHLDADCCFGNCLKQCGRQILNLNRRARFPVALRNQSDSEFRQ